MSSISYGLTLDEAETKASEAAELVLQGMEKATIDSLKDLAETEEQKANALAALAVLRKNSDFRDRLTSAFVSWLAETHVILIRKEE